MYLNELDNYVKRELKCKYYVRYVDDFVLLSKNKEELKIWRTKIKQFVREKLSLEIHPNKVIMQEISQ
ncbi:MAG: RNA-directed DNA polymerase [Candidatus Peribacteria bacterium]|nr:RNA-directed DNA polymerase [Candidatus Peribacteria bacterium]